MNPTPDRKSPVRLAAVGFSLRDEVLLRSLLFLIASKSGKRWILVDDLECDVAICDASPATTDWLESSRMRDRKPVCIMLDRGSGHPDASGLPWPPRPAELLNALSAAVQSHPSRSEEAIPVINTGQVEKSVAAFRHPLPELCGQLRTLRQERTTYQIRVGSTRMLIRSPEMLFGAEGGFHQVLLRHLGEATVLPSPERLTEQAALSVRGSMEWRHWMPLSWACAEYLPKGQLLAELQNLRSFRLARWPDFGRLGTNAQQMRLSALLSKKDCTVSELVRESGQSAEQVIRFLNSCALASLLDLRKTTKAPIIPPQGTRPALLPKSGWKQVFVNIRQALGIP